MENTGVAPTGCYKCGRPGHWSRDCPSSAPNPNPSPSTTLNPNPNSNLYSSSTPSSFKTGGGGGGGGTSSKSSEKPKKGPRTRPKLTPELLLSNDGLGYVLRHFPRSFKYRGRGHEVSDLGCLIGLYTEWHSHLLPYYSFDQFIHKVEQVGTTRRIKTCIRDLRERVANGGDPTKLHEQPIEDDGINNEQAPAEVMNSEEPSHYPGLKSSENHDADDIQEEMLHEIYKKAGQEASQTLQSETVAADRLSVGSLIKEVPNQGPDKRASCSSSIQITEDQKTRIEANRLKALERAAARVHSLPAT